jgi:DNA ligase-1
MLAATYNPDDAKHVQTIKLPVWASPKIDGIRALVVNGVVQSRSGKPIPNPVVQARYGRPEFEGLDGELAVGPTNASDLMQRSMKVMSLDTTFEDDSLSFNLFDVWSARNDSYNTRLLALNSREVGHRYVFATMRASVIHHRWLYSLAELDNYEAAMLDLGYEGVMLNAPDLPYKHGRSGKKNPELLKVKRFVDDEAVIIGFEEMYHNDNVAFKDELGRTKRQTLQANLRGAGVLGSLRLRATTGTFKGAEFNCSGFTANQRAELWAKREQLLGQLGTFKHFEQVGAKDRPRQPVWKSLRSVLDT